MVTFEQTRDGHLAARVGHITFGMVPRAGGPDRIMIRYPAKDPADCMIGDFSHPTGADACSASAFRAHVEEHAAHLSEEIALGRVSVPKCSTPWGRSERSIRYADGVVSHSTAGHGGIGLSDAMNALVDPEWRARDGWYEEDICWAIVACTFPHLFTARERRFAESTVAVEWPAVAIRLGIGSPALSAAA